MKKTAIIFITAINLVSIGFALEIETLRNSSKISSIDKNLINETKNPVPEPILDTQNDRNKVNFCWFKELKGNTCVYKCKNGSVYEMPAQRPSPWDEFVIPCPQIVFPFSVSPVSLETEKHNRSIFVESVEGVKIDLDFKTTVIHEDWAGQDVAAKPLAISVSNPAFNETDKIKIALKAWCKAHDGQIVSKTHKAELSYAGKGKFTGIIKEGVMLYSDYAGQYYHNLVITVNGRRLHNLKDNSDSFNINFGFDPGKESDK